jgi:hypothetical protein
VAVHVRFDKPGAAVPRTHTHTHTHTHARTHAHTHARARTAAVGVIDIRETPQQPPSLTLRIECNNSQRVRLRVCMCARALVVYRGEHICLCLTGAVCVCVGGYIYTF